MKARHSSLEGVPRGLRKIAFFVLYRGVHFHHGALVRSGEYTGITLVAEEDRTEASLATPLKYLGDQSRVYQRRVTVSASKGGYDRC